MTMQDKQKEGTQVGHNVEKHYNSCAEKLKYIKRV